MGIDTTVQLSNLSQVASFSKPAKSISLLSNNKDKEIVEGTLLSKQKEKMDADQVLMSSEVRSARLSSTPFTNHNPLGQLQSKEPDHNNSKVQEKNIGPSPSVKDLSDKELEIIQELKYRDTEVRAHEQAHLSAAGDLKKTSTGFDYKTGPDGKQYAVGGEVNIDTSRILDDPKATLIKAQKIRRAATAPVDPSPQDRLINSEAARMESVARFDISQNTRVKQAEYVEENTPKIDFLGPQTEQNKKNIQDTYSRIQNASVLEEPTKFIDSFI